ncbi:hypothetical protein EWM64_g4518 [Hericium alpestre]|uniref:Uncharacterized protein n=1 Tax=Hericium alpestre TaxID=135208 RepID=A0A4Y9ZZW7_9AGAM|nr:hypothetical protein EWM64_g4518 [Hericium alpestre]
MQDQMQCDIDENEPEPHVDKNEPQGARSHPPSSSSWQQPGIEHSNNEDEHEHVIVRARRTYSSSRGKARINDIFDESEPSRSCPPSSQRTVSASQKNIPAQDSGAGRHSFSAPNTIRTVPITPARMGLPRGSSTRQTLRTPGPRPHNGEDEDDTETEMQRTKTRKPTNADLPPGMQPRWQDIFLPMFRDFMGTRADPWDTQELIEPIQSTWNMVFLSVPHEFKDKEDMVYSLLMQQIYEWRRGFAYAAIDAVADHFWSVESVVNNNLNAKEQYAAKMLGIHDAGDGATLPFIFRGSYKDDDGNIVYEDAFMSRVILQTLAVAHLQSVSEMPKSSRQPDWPAGALALATAVVERAWTRWLCPDPDAPDPLLETRIKSRFSYGIWGDVTDDYAEVIRNFTPEKWDALAKAALKLLQPKQKVINAPGKSAICACRRGLKALANK